jgi:predicted porin
MKFATFAVTAVALAAASAANAQDAQQSTTNVTLYGVADAYVQFANGAANLSRVQSGGLQGSRFGLRVTEDLGGGLRALAVLESGINLDDGTNGQGAFWGRQSYVGIGSAQFGTLTLGRQYGSVYNLSSDFSEFSNVSTGASTAVIGGFGGYEPVRGGTTTTATGNGGPARINNSVKYETPTFSGFKAGALWGFGESTGATNEQRTADVYARYSGYGFDAMLSFVDDKQDLTSQDVRTTSGAVGYTYGDWHGTAGVISVNDRSAVDADGQGFWVGGDYRFGVNTVRAQYVQNKAKNVNEGKTQAFGVGYQYDLSKRTALYSAVTRFKNEGDGYADRWASAVPAGLTTAGDRNITEFTAGVRHSF